MDCRPPREAAGEQPLADLAWQIVLTNLGPDRIRRYKNLFRNTAQIFYQPVRTKDRFIMPNDVHYYKEYYIMVPFKYINNDIFYRQDNVTFKSFIFRSQNNLRIVNLLTTRLIVCQVKNARCKKSTSGKYTKCRTHQLL